MKIKSKSTVVPFASASVTIPPQTADETPEPDPKLIYGSFEWCADFLNRVDMVATLALNMTLEEILSRFGPEEYERLKKYKFMQPRIEFQGRK